MLSFVAISPSIRNAFGIAVKTFGVILRHDTQSWQVMSFPAQQRSDSYAFSKKYKEIQRRYS